MIPYPDFSHAKIIVLGDIILDRYFWGDVHRISPEAPVPVVTINKKTMNLGGAGNVAMNLKGLGCHHVLMGFAGDDANGAALSNILQQEGIQNHLITIQNHPTTTKSRIIGQGQQLVRLDEEKEPRITDTHRNQLFKYFDEALPGATGVIRWPRFYIGAIRPRAASLIGGYTPQGC